MKTYIILGYGIPKDIEQDDNYRRYLGVVFNTIYTETQNMHTQTAIVTCGGLTDVYKPYKRTESGELYRYLHTLAKRTCCRKVTKHWRYFFEKTSLSTLENLVYSKRLLEQKKMNASSVTIFCDATRMARIRRLAKKIFGKARLVAVDFDLSENRYIDPELMRAREQASRKLDDWALERPANLKEYRKSFLKKFDLLRKAGPKRQQEALRAWWQKPVDPIRSTPRQTR